MLQDMAPLHQRQPLLDQPRSEFRLQILQIEAGADSDRHHQQLCVLQRSFRFRTIAVRTWKLSPLSSSPSVTSAIV